MNYNLLHFGEGRDVIPAQAGIQGKRIYGFLLEFIPMEIGAGMTILEIDLDRDVYPEHFRIHILIFLILEVTHFTANFLHILVGYFRWDDANNLK
jgi:hypothetical protein